MSTQLNQARILYKISVEICEENDRQDQEENNQRIANLESVMKSEQESRLSWID